MRAFMMTLSSGVAWVRGNRRAGIAASLPSRAVNPAPGYHENLLLLPPEGLVMPDTSDTLDDFEKVEGQYSVDADPADTRLASLSLCRSSNIFGSISLMRKGLVTTSSLNQHRQYPLSWAVM